MSKPLLDSLVGSIKMFKGEIMYYFYFTIVTLVILLLLSVTQIVKMRKLKKMQKEKIKIFVKENALSNSELKLFVSEMRATRDYINSIESRIQLVKNDNSQRKVAKAVAESKKIFEYLMEFPKDLLYYDLFLYRNLPTLYTVMDKVNLDEHNSEELLLLTCQNIETDFNKLKEQIGEDNNVLEEFIK